MTKHSALFFACLITFMVCASCAPDLAVRKDQAETSRRIGEGYLAEGKVSTALAELLKAEKLYDKDPFVHYDLGLAYFAKEAFELAIEHFNKAVALKSDYSEAFNAMGTVHLRLMEWDKAISSFNKALANLVYATPYFALNNLGEAYRGKKDYERAIGFYNKALKENPRYAHAHRGLGLVYLDMDNYEAAAFSLKKAVQYAPNFASAYHDLGRAYAGQYHTKKAVAAFKKAMDLAPDTPLADRASAEIKGLMD